MNPLTGDFSPTSVKLREERDNHLCWDVEGENGPVLLMGGYYSHYTEMVSSDGLTSSAGLTSSRLADDARYGINITIC